MSRRLNVLLSVYACGDSGCGVEGVIGLNWVRALSRRCKITVITESGCEKQIEAAKNRLFAGRIMPDFHYVDIGGWGRRLAQQHGNWWFYWFYRKWQKKVFRLAEQLCAGNSYDIIHHLNLVDFREPGYLWELAGKHKFIWGPVSGFAAFPEPFFADLGRKAVREYRLKNRINSWQVKHMRRIRKAIATADRVIAATAEDADFIEKHYHTEACIIPETGAVTGYGGRIHSAEDGLLRVAWCGVMDGRKALDLALKAMAEIKKAKRADLIELHIVGDGEYYRQWMALAEKLGVAENCVWYGRMEHEKTLDIMAMCDLFWFTGWREATSTAIVEALAMGLPALCHDCGGMGEAVNDSCGIKVRLINPEYSIRNFSRALMAIMDNPDIIEKLSRGALIRANELTFQSGAERMMAIYNSLSNTETE